ncbi:MAG TPA: hypothetical protein VMZ53_20850 [Kofleriaceae bacterium]|nr:hypothetical protein [Kofleriaceae bacterium]
MRLAIIASILLGLAACGGGDLSPKEGCNQSAAALCERLYACFTSAELAAGGFPPNEAGCVTKYQTDYGCSAQTVENTCDGNEKYHGDQADDCVDQIHGLECSQVRDANFNYETGLPACDKVCSI